MAFLGLSITKLGDSGCLGPDCWVTESAYPAVLSGLRLNPTFSKSSACEPDALEILSVSLIPGAFVHQRIQLSFFNFQGLAHVVADVVRLLVVAIFDIILFSRCCCGCCRTNSSCRRRSSISLLSCSNTNCRSHSRCSSLFLALRLSSSISSISRHLDERELAIIGSFFDVFHCFYSCINYSLFCVFISSRCG